MRAAGAPGGPGKLTTAQQEYVVERLAAFCNPGDVVRLVREKFGIALTRQAVEQYDPTRDRRCPARWTALFRLRRQAILESKGLHGAVARAAQSNSRERVARSAIESLAAEMLETLARQMPQPRAAEPVEPRSDAERARAILALLDEVQVALPDAGATALLNEVQIDDPARG
jgi:hypothetical protein